MVAAACHSRAEPSLGPVDACAPGEPSQACATHAGEARQGGLRSLTRSYEETKSPDSVELDFMIFFSTDYDDVVSFMTRQVGTVPIRAHEVPGLRYPTGTFDIWVSSDGTWVANREAMKLDWYSLPVQSDRSTQSLDVAAIRPASVSAAIWKALGRFLIEHPPAQP
jgi:hypothetical protein